MPEPPALVAVQGLEKGFPRRGGLFGRGGEPVRAVAGISFEIRPGETLGLVGQSGCGKTTTGRALLRLVEPDSGSIHFDGRDVRALDPRGLRGFRRDAQIVFQDPFGSLNPRMSSYDALEEVLFVHGLAEGNAGRRRRADELLERVGLGPQHGHRRPHELSGGQRQRLGIARALSVAPRFIVLDEPVSSLDVSVRAQVVQLLLGLQADLGLAYLFIAHDLALVEQVSHRIAVMHEGRIVETGPTEDLFRRPVHPWTRTMLAAIPRLDPGAAGPSPTGEPPARE